MLSTLLGNQRKSATSGLHCGTPADRPLPAMNVTASQQELFHPSVYLIRGRRQDSGITQFLKDCWQFAPRGGHVAAAGRF